MKFEEKKKRKSFNVCVCVLLAGLNRDLNRVSLIMNNGNHVLEKRHFDLLCDLSG